MAYNDHSTGKSTRRTILKMTGASALVGALPQSSNALQAAQGDGEVGAMIDTHIHAVASNLPGLKPKPEVVEKLYKAPLPEMAAFLKAEMARGNVKIAFGMGALDAGPDDPLGIAQTIELSKLVPRLKAIGVADPRHIEPDHLKKVEAQIERHRTEIVALKAYLGYLHFGPEDPRYVPYYKLAAKYKLPVIVHTGDNWSTTAKVKFAHPLRMDEVAVDHSDVRFILAHFGNPWLMDAAEVLYKNANVWTDLSGLFVGSDEDIQALINDAKVPASPTSLLVADLKKAIAYVGDPSKFLYGSDWPLAPMASYRRLIDTLIPKEHQAAVFHTNAEKLFGV